MGEPNGAERTWKRNTGAYCGRMCGKRKKTLDRNLPAEKSAALPGGSEKDEK